MTSVVAKKSKNEVEEIEPDEGMLTKRQLAERLNVSLRTVESWMSQKLVPYIKIKKTVRFIWTDVEQALKRGSSVGYGPGAAP
jgi:excisionase family DNA binding protein